MAGDPQQLRTARREQEKSLSEIPVAPAPGKVELLIGTDGVSSRPVRRIVLRAGEPQALQDSASERHTQRAHTRETHL